ncbi:MAG: serine/threonine-protein kinase [Planctomycetota bacterium]
MTEAAEHRWEQAKALFETLCAAPPATCEQALRAAPPAVAREVRALLDADRATETLLDGDALTLLGETLLAGDDDGEDLLGAVVDGHRLEAVLGRGGSATVYRGVAADGCRAAIKVLRRDLGAGDVAARFAREHEVLRGLDHPGLIRVRAAGHLDDGRPWLRTDLVDGAPLTAHCAEHRLPARARVALLARVCDAVHHAHAHLVVHRDLKPSNILVGADGAPRVLDFGVAKLLDRDADPGHTDTGARAPFTPRYASPEQVRGEPVSTRSDVYALGVLLCELLTGHGPYAVADDDRRALEAAVRNAPPRPAAAMPGDLWIITACCLRKEPTERYASARHLADDLRRWLDGRPPLAARERPLVRLVRAARRRPLRTAAVVALVCLPLGGWLGALHSLDEVERSERIAWRAHAGAVQAAELVTQLLEQLAADPGADADALRRAAAGASRWLADLDEAPEAQARLALSLARVHLQLGEVDTAAVLLRPALLQTRTTRGLGWRDEERCLDGLVTALGERDRAAARAFAAELLDLRRTHRGADDAATQAAAAALRRLDDPR